MKRLKSFMFDLLLCFIALFSTPVGATPAPTPPKFIIGVWYQPTYLFDTWKARGINTLVGTDFTDHDQREAWKAAARAHGFFYIIKPVAGHPEYDANDPYLLAWSLVDEPDGAGNQTPDVVNANAADMNKANPAIKTFLNLDGTQFQWKPVTTYQAYVKAGSYVAMDYYPINKGDGPAGLANMSGCLDKLKTYDPTRPEICFIECSNQNLKVQGYLHDAANQPLGEQIAARMRGPTPGEMLQEVQIAVNHGVAGICYFPDIIGVNFEGYDGTPADVAAQMTTINQQLTAGIFSTTAGGVAAASGSSGNATASSPTTAPAVTTNAGGPPNGPYVFASTAVTYNSATVSWYDSAENETSYLVERATALAGPYTTVATPGPNAGKGGQMKYVDATVLPATHYFYRVSCLNGIYQSGFATGDLTTLAAPATQPIAKAPYDGVQVTISGVVYTLHKD